MRFDMAEPCADCPFRREGGVRLTSARVRQIAGAMLSRQGGTFACHRTTAAGGSPAGRERHCAGALIFAERNGNATQAMRIAERLRLYRPDGLGPGDGVFADMDEMLGAALDAPARRE